MPQGWSTLRPPNGGSTIDHSLALPPGFRARPGIGDPWGAANRAAARGAEPGSVFWDGAHGRCRAAFVFAPDRPLGDTGLLLNLGALALFDALAVLAPPQVPVHIRAPDEVIVDGGRVGALRVAEAPTLAGAIPDWAVLGIDVSVDVQAGNPGETLDQTCLAEEGFGDITPADVLLHTSRHLLSWLDTWRQDGAAALAEAVSMRAFADTVTA